MTKASSTTPIILTGTKIDIRDSEQVRKEMNISNEEIATKEMGEELAKEIGAYAYVECSAFLMKNVQLVFDKALECHFANKESVGDGTGGQSSDKQTCCSLQ